MTPSTLLAHCDSGLLWPGGDAGPAAADLATAYQAALAVRDLRIARGERPVGYKVGFTNRGIWDRYNVAAPIWGTVWDHTLASCDGEAEVSLTGCCQPRLEPEVVFRLRAAPSAAPALDELFDCIDWMAPGIEVVQSHLPGWKFTAPDTVADGGLHARLVVGPRLDIRAVAGSAQSLEAQLVSASVSLRRGSLEVECGQGANVLEGPLHALQYFVEELHRCHGAPSLDAGQIVTTGTWTDAWPVAAGETWTAQFGTPLQPLSVRFT